VKEAKAKAVTSMIDLDQVFQGIPANARRYAVVGHPVGHSLSPAMHGAAFAALGIAAVYRPVDVSPTDWPDFLRQAVERLDGFNVTVPHKEALLKGARPRGVDVNVSPEAQAAGAVNTVDREPLDAGPAWTLYNTDGLGFAADLEELGVDPSGRNIVLLGAGGAARAVLSAFPTLEPARLTVVSRTVGKAVSLASEFRERFAVGPDRLTSLGAAEAGAAVKEASLLVNATSAGLRPGEEPPLDLACLHDRLTVYDLIYHRETELLAAAKAAGADAFGGLGMLVHQAAESFKIWFGRKPPVDAMRRAAEEELRRRV
jgi:shikimate dehydrogenase